MKGAKQYKCVAIKNLKNNYNTFFAPLLLLVVVVVVRSFSFRVKL